MPAGAPSSTEVGRRDARRVVVGRVADVPEGSRLLVEVNGRSVGIFNVKGSFYALLNRCPHMGAELCKGDVLGLIESDGPGDVRLDSSRPFIACPWHGWEYDLENGQSWFNPGRTRARAFPIEVEGGERVAAELSAGTAQSAADKTSVVDQVNHRIKGPFVAEVLPIEVSDDYIVISVGRPLAAQ